MTMDPPRHHGAGAWGGVPDTGPSEPPGQAAGAPAPQRSHKTAVKLAPSGTEAPERSTACPRPDVRGPRPRSVLTSGVRLWPCISVPDGSWGLRLLFSDVASGSWLGCTGPSTRAVVLLHLGHQAGAGPPAGADGERGSWIGVQVEDRPISGASRAVGHWTPRTPLWNLGFRLPAGSAVLPWSSFLRHCSCVADPLVTLTAAMDTPRTARLRPDSPTLPVLAPWRPPHPEPATRANVRRRGVLGREADTQPSCCVHSGSK